MAKKAKIFELYEEYEKKRNKENADSSSNIFDLYDEYEKKLNEENARNIWAPSEAQTSRQTVDQFGNLGNMVKKTETETLPRITNEAIKNYNLSKTGRDYLSNYTDSTSYTDVKNDIEELKNRKGGAARRNRDTAMYDRAIAMLEEYAANNYSLNDNKTSYADKEAIYEDNKQIEEGLGEKSNSATDPMYRDYALMTWLGSYDHKGINDSATNQAAIKSFNEATGGKGYDLSNELGELKDDEIANKADEIRTYFQDKYGYKYNTDYLNAAQNFYSDLQNRYNKAKTDNKTYERTGEAAAYTADIVKKDDYADKSTVGDYGTPTTKEDIDEYLKNNQVVDYNNIQGFDSKNVDSLPDKLGSFLSAEDIKDQNTSSEFSPERKIAINLQKTDNAWTHPFDTSQSGYDDLMTEGYNNGWDVINDEEKGAYYYIYNTEGKEAAYEYLNSLKNTLQKRKNYDNVKEATQNSADSGTVDNLDFILRSAASVPDNAFGGATGTLDNVAHYISGEDIEPYSSAHAAALSAAATREASGEALDEQFWHTDSPWGVNPSDIYGGVMSSADMLSSFAVGEAPYSALMGLSAAESTARDLYEQGEDNATIAAVSTASGIAEALFEKLSVEQIWNIANIDGAKTAKEIVKKYAYNMARAAGVEASEEVATEAANMVVDNIVRGSRSDTANASVEDIGSRLYKAGVGGAIGGLLGGGGATTLSAVAKGTEIVQDKSERNKYIASVGADVTNAGNTQALLDTADQMKDNAEVQAQAEKVRQAQTNNAEKGTESTAKALSRETGKLYAAIQDSNVQGIQNAEASEIKAAIKQAYAAETGEDVKSDTVTQAAEAIYKSEYTGEKLTRAERNLASTSQAQSAVESVRNNPDLIEQGTQKAQERAFNKYISTAQLTQKQETKADEDVDIAEFNVHKDDGKVYTADGRKQVDIASVASIGENDITFALKDGQTESAKALDMPTKQAVLAQSVLDVQKSMGVDLTPEIANTLYKGYEQSDIKSVSAYMQDAQKVFFNGYTNNTKIDNTINLPQGLRNRLYSMGRQLAASHTQAQQQAVNNRVKGNKARKGSVTFVDGIRRGQLDARRRAGVDTVENLAKSLGFDVVFYRSTKNGKGRYSSEYVRKNKFTAEGQQAPSGFWRGGKMYLDINAGMNGEGLILFTASHELVHMIREGSPEAFQELADFLVKNYAEQGVNINDLVLKEMSKSTNLTRDEAFEEVIAESCETFLRDTHLNDKAQELYKQNPTLWSRIREALKRIINSIKEAYAVARPQSEEARITNRADIETLEKAYDLWTKGIIKSAENLRNMESNRTDTKYQGRTEAQDTEYLDAVERGDMETAQRMVDEAAKKAGYNTPVLYHGTQKFGFTEFDLNKLDDKLSIFLTSTEETASTYSGVNGVRRIGEKNALDKRVDDLSPKELVEAVNKYKGASQFDVEYKYYSLDDINKMVDGAAVSLKQLKEFANEVLPTYENADAKSSPYTEQTIYVADNIKELIDHIDRNDYTWVASYLKTLSEQAKEFDTKEYERLYDTLHLLGTIRLSGINDDYVIISDVGDGMFYQSMREQTLRDMLKNESNYGNYATYAKLDNPLVIEAEGANWNRIPIEKDIWFELSKLDRDIDREGNLTSYTRAISAYAKDNGYDGVIFKNLNDNGGENDYVHRAESDVYVVFDSSQVKSADPVTYDNDGNVIPLSERFNVSEQDIRYKSRIDINKALNPSERSSFYQSLMPNNQREYYRVADNAIIVPDNSNDQNFKLVIYSGDHVDYEITGVYKISNYEYNIHDKVPNAFDALSKMERDEIDESDARAILGNCELLFGSVFKKYNPQTGRYTKFARSSIKSTSSYQKESSRTGVSDRTGQTGIKYLSDRDENQFQDFEISDWEFDDTTADTVAREYVSHHEDIGEVLKNIADIDITPAKVTAIVNRVLRENIGTLDKTTRELLSTEVQIALDRVNRDDPATVINNMTQAVRDAIENAYVPSEKAEADYKELLSVFKGKRFYLSEEQLNYLKEHDSSLGKIHRELQNRVNIVDKNNLKRSINGGYQNAQELSLEGLYDVLESPDEYLSYKRDEWDKYGYKAPFIIRDALNKLRDMRSQRITEVYSGNAIDDMAVTLSAKITGGIVEAKYNSRKNPYITKLVNDLKAKRSEAVKKQKEKYQKKLSELKQKERERAAKRERELSDKYKEQRERGRENRKRTEFRNKIRKLMNSFQSKLTKPRDGSYVPRELIAQTVDVLNSINMDTGRSVNLSEKIAALRNTYDGLRKDAEAQAIYNDTISEMLRGLSVAIKNTSIMDMSLEQLQMTYDALRSLDHYIRESVKMTDTEEKRSAHALGRAMIAETREASGGNKGILSGYVQAQLRADVMFNRLGGFKKNSTWLQMARMLNDGQLHMTQLQMEFSKIFADVLTDIKQLRTLSNTKNLIDIGLVDDDGKTVKITRGMMLSLYMHLLNEDNTRHVMGGGLTVPGIKEYYKGDLTKAFGEKQRSVRVGQIDFTEYAEGIKTVIEEQLTDYEKVWIGLAHEFFDDASRNAINDTTMKLYGFKRATVTNYFPIHTDSNYRAASFESITRDMSLENSGFMKERIKASNPILLEDIVDVINDQIQKVSKYCGLTIPINNFQKVYGTTLAGYESSLQKEINKKFSGSKSNTSATKYIDNLITDLTSGRQTSEGPFAKFFTAARANLAKATLSINVRVAIAQAASYPTAAAEIGWKPLLKAAVKGGRSNRMFSRADRAAIEEVSPLLWLRTQGYSNTEIGDIKELRKQKHKIEGKFKKAMGWIELFDGMTVGRLYYAAQYAVDEKYPSLKRGTEEYKQKVAEVYNDIIEKTQPNYTVLQRPDILRNPNAVVKSLTMFMTQRLQNFNIVYDAAGTYNKYRKDFKAGKNGVTALDVKEAGTKLRRAVVSQIVANATIAGMKLFSDFLLHSLTGYRDDDDELTAESVMLALMNNFADSIFSAVLFGSDLYKLIMSVYKGEKYDGVSQSGIDSLKDMLSSVADVGSNVFQAIKGEETLNWEYFHTLGKQICLVFGIPLNNAEKIGKAVYYWTSDITSEKLFDSDVKRSNKQNIHRVETRMSAGDTEEAKEIVNAMIKDKISNGKTEKEAKQSVRTSFTQEYKPRYLEAVKNNNEAEIKNIRQLLLNTGVYGSLSDLDKSMAEWRKDLNKKE